KLGNAQRTFNRDKELLKINAVTRVKYDADETALEQARAAYQQAVHNQQSAATTSAGLKSKANAARHHISAAAALVEQRKAELKMAKKQLDHAYVTAPSDGIVTKRSVDQGQYVLAGQSLCAVVDKRHIWITANFKETQLHKLKPGQPVTIGVDAYPGLKLKGSVSSNSGATGAKFALIPPNNATGNFIKVTQRIPVRIQIDPSSLPGSKPAHANDSSDGPNSQNIANLVPGLSVFVKVKTN